MSVRVRFAPSPTGHLHIGGARTALFNWLFARQQGGSFILRIEDTDEKRSSEAMVKGILDGLRWLGLDWDEGPVFQSRRTQVYRNSVEKLLRSGAAYRDFSAPDSPADAYRTFRESDPDEADRRAEEGEPYAVRFTVPESVTVTFEDLVFGRIDVDSATLDDFVICRSDGNPTYHLSVVSDDAEMAITHVIRGADHLSNTPKHVLLFQALGIPVPVFAHLPLILGPDKKRLSKRHGATSLTEFAEKGLLPEAVRSYIALLGWSPGDDSEVLGTEELIGRFDLARVNRANAVFDYSKLEWTNKRFISSAPAPVLEPYVIQTLVEAGLGDAAWRKQSPARLHGVIDLLKSRVQGLRDFAEYGRAFFDDGFDYDDSAVARFLRGDDPAVGDQLRDLIEQLHSRLEELEEFTLENTESVLRSLAEEAGVKAGKLIGAVRVALTGRGQAPGIFEVLVALGREKSLERLGRCAQMLRGTNVGQAPDGSR